MASGVMEWNSWIVERSVVTFGYFRNISVCSLHGSIDLTELSWLLGDLG